MAEDDPTKGKTRYDVPRHTLPHNVRIEMLEERIDKLEAQMKPVPVPVEETDIEPVL